MNYRVTHVTTYEYHEPVSLSQHVIRLRPRETPGQRCTKHDLSVTPSPRHIDLYRDYFGNAVAFVSIEQPHTRLCVHSSSEVQRGPAMRMNPKETPSWEQVRDHTRGSQMGAALEAVEFLYDSPLIRRDDIYAGYSAKSFSRGRPILEAVLDLTKRIHLDFKFDPDATTVATPIDEVFKNKRGVCQDFAQVQIACLRSLGLPARYVSGYLETIPPPGQEKLVGSDASHAWVSVFCHSLGWIDLDPTNNAIVSHQHVTVGWGRDFSDVSPVRGVILGSGQHAVKVSVDVERLDK